MSKSDWRMADTSAPDAMSSVLSKRSATRSYISSVPSLNRISLYCVLRTVQPSGDSEYVKSRLLAAPSINKSAKLMLSLMPPTLMPVNSAIVAKKVRTVYQCVLPFTAANSTAIGDHWGSNPAFVKRALGAISTGRVLSYVSGRAVVTDEQQHEVVAVRSAQWNRAGAQSRCPGPRSLQSNNPAGWR